MSQYLNDLRATIHAMNWPQFGPEDVGGVWDKLGVIYKRHLPGALFMSNDLWLSMGKVHKQLEKEILYGRSELPVYYSPCLPPGTATDLQNHFFLEVE